MTQYTMDDYKLDSARTASNLFCKENIAFSTLETELQNAASSTELDFCKKSLFYNKEFTRYNQVSFKEDEDLWDSLLNKIHPDHGKSVDILHGMIGIITEAEELASLLLSTSSFDCEFDRTNLIEELGDILWYQAMILRSLDISFEKVAFRNIEKLRKRFPDKFTSNEALNRDLDTERAILERDIV